MIDNIDDLFPVKRFNDYLYKYENNIDIRVYIYIYMIVDTISLVISTVNLYIIMIIIHRFNIIKTIRKSISRRIR